MQKRRWCWNIFGLHEGLYQMTMTQVQSHMYIMLIRGKYWSKYWDKGLNIYIYSMPRYALCFCKQRTCNANAWWDLWLGFDSEPSCSFWEGLHQPKRLQMQTGGSRTTDTTTWPTSKAFPRDDETTLCVRRGSAASCKSNLAKHKIEKCQRFLVRARYDFFTEYINHKACLMTRLAKDKILQKIYYAVGEGFGSARDIYEKAKRLIQVEP